MISLFRLVCFSRYTPGWGLRQQNFGYTTYMNDCPFCDIVSQGRVLLRETSLVVVILSNPRLMPGHTLVIPKRHVERMVELTSEERVEMLNTAIEMEERLLAAGAPGCDIRQHYRPFLPRGAIKVNHVHIHVQPRSLEDELFRQAEKGERALFAPLSDAERDEWQGKLS
jgi:histidine triad (HIT) family protein